jgi:hypothetical protein
LFRWGSVVSHVDFDICVEIILGERELWNPS